MDEYKKNIAHIKRFLNGRTASILKEFEKEKKVFVREEAFEQAAATQKKIEQIRFITSESYDPFRYEEKPDFYFERIRTEVGSLLEILQKENVPVTKLDRIECYDISNFQGTNPTGSMVVFIHGDADKKEYRRFHIRSKKTPDDFAMHQEMMARRLKHLEDWGVPDLLVIDGGKGQVSSVLEILVQKNAHIPVIGLAKREETIVIPEKLPFMNKIEFVEIKLSHSTPGVNLLRRIRDEAHRFAITYHRNLRKKKMMELLSG
jgi:excinuclease ABC subunit C